jgi:hypothetical protein
MAQAAVLYTYESSLDADEGVQFAYRADGQAFRRIRRFDARWNGAYWSRWNAVGSPVAGVRQQPNTYLRNAYGQLVLAWMDRPATVRLPDAPKVAQ